MLTIRKIKNKIIDLSYGVVCIDSALTLELILYGVDHVDNAYEERPERGEK